ncbi:hypothetical protein ABZ250_39535 [Streptomyces afghaniensis]
MQEARPSRQHPTTLQPGTDHTASVETIDNDRVGTPLNILNI